MTGLALDAYGCTGLFGDGMRGAGFETVTLDSDAAALAHCPGEVVVGDALKLLRDVGFVRQFSWVHTAPPCQPSTAAKHLAHAQGKTGGRVGQRDLIGPTRYALRRVAGRLGIPWTIENVERSALRGRPRVVTLCGSSYGLPIRRHRLFEHSPDLPLAGSVCRHHEAWPRDERTGKPRPWGVYYAVGDDIPSGGRTVRSVEQGHEVMGVRRRVPWPYLCEACPPVYGEDIGRQVAHALGRSTGWAS